MAEVLTVLMVEDSEDDALRIVETLRRDSIAVTQSQLHPPDHQAELTAKGYRLLVARSGEAAIALAQAENPALIVMDMQLPGVDGLEAIRRIRDDPHLADRPIIAITALTSTSDRDRCLAAGANQHLGKPLKLKHLSTTIQHLLTPLSPSTP